MAATTIDELQVIITAQNKQFQAALRDVSKQLDGVSTDAQRSGNKMSAALEKVGKVAKVATAAGFAALTAATIAAGKASWDQVNAVQQASATLGRYYDSAEDVAMVQQELIKYAQSDMGVLFNRKDLFAAAGNLAMYGSNAKDVSKQVEILSRGMASNVLSWDEMNAVVGRVISSGKLSRTEFEMLAKAGYNLDSSLANSSVTADKFFEILDNSIPKDISQDMDNIVPVGIRLQSSFRNIGNAILGVNKLQDGFMPGSIGRRIIDVMKQLTKFSNGVAPLVRDSITNIISSMEELASKVGSYLSPKFKELLAVIQTQLAPVLRDLAQNILIPLAALVGTSLVVALGLAIDVTTLLLQAALALLEILEPFAPVILGLVAAYTAYQLVAGIVTGVQIALTGAMVAGTAASGAYAVGVGAVTLAQQAAAAATTLWQGAIALLNPVTLGLAAAVTAVVLAIEAFKLNQANANLVAQNTITLQERETQLRQMGKEAIQQQEDALRSYTDAKLEETNASLALMNAEDQETAAKKRLDDMTRNGVDPASREYKRAQLELEAASGRVKSAQDKLSDSSSVAKERFDDVGDAVWAQIRASKEDELQKLAQAGKYDEVNQKLRDLAKETHNYKDANGEMTKFSERDMNNMALAIGDSLSKVHKGYGKFWDASQESVDKAARNVKKVEAEFRASGQAFSQGLASGITGDAWRVENAAIGAADRANIAFKNRLDIRSPSRVMAESGGDFSLGIAEGIKSKAKQVAMAAKEIAGVAVGSSDLSIGGISTNLPSSEQLSSKLDLSLNTRTLEAGGRLQPVNVQIDGQTLLSFVIDGVNGKSFMTNQAVIDF